MDVDVEQRMESYKALVRLHAKGIIIQAIDIDAALDTFIDDRVAAIFEGAAKLTGAVRCYQEMRELHLNNRANTDEDQRAD